MVDLSEVQEAILRAGMQWSAERTEVSDRLAPGVEGFLGLNMMEEERLELIGGLFAAFVPPALAPPPPGIDWRDKDGQNWVAPIRNQNPCGSCVAFATVATLESRLAIAAGEPPPVDLSEAHLFFCGAGAACATGWNFEPALSQCRDVGVGLESDFPYVPANQPCRNIPSRAFVRDGWNTPVHTVHRKWAIVNNGPVIAGMRVFEDFGYYVGGVYRHAAGTYLGLHAVCVVGYNDPGQFWIVKNSWGENWGEQGYFRIGYDQCGLDGEFPFYDPLAYEV